MFEAFIFDMDGVIIDSEPLHFQVDQDTMSHFGVAIRKEDLEEYVGMTNPEMWSGIRIKYRLKESVPEIIDYQLKEKLAALSELNVAPIGGIVELIQELHGRAVKIGLASSSPRIFIEAVLNKFGITRFFDCIMSGEEVRNGKPAPDVYVETANLLGVSADRCVVLEDSKHGVAAAKAAGMKCIGFQNPNSGHQDLSNADFVVHSINEIKLNKI